MKPPITTGLSAGKNNHLETTNIFLSTRAQKQLVLASQMLIDAVLPVFYDNKYSSNH